LPHAHVPNPMGDTLRGPIFTCHNQPLKFEATSHTCHKRKIVLPFELARREGI